MPMTRFTVLALGATLLTAASPQNRAHGAQGIVEVSQGVYTFTGPCRGEDCVGDLLVCPELNSIIRHFGTIKSLEGICDDAEDDAASRCAGKLTTLSEVCMKNNTQDDPGGQQFIGLLIVRSLRGKSRTCFDPTGASNCTGPLPGGVVVVRRSDVAQQERFVFAPQNQAPGGDLQRGDSQINGKVVPTSTAPFAFNGQTIELGTNVLTVSGTQQADPDTDNCASMNAILEIPPACGFASVAVAEQGPSCCGDCNGDGEVKIDELVTGVNRALTGCRAE